MLFSDHYQAARQRFLEQVEQLGGTVTEYQHPEAGPHGQPLFVDVATIGGGPAPKKALLTLSATHGCEGFYGSACQSTWLSQLDASQLADDTTLIFIHAINPFGFAHIRRTTHEGVDLNRNFIDFAAPLPQNSGYDGLADAFVPTEWQGPIREAADQTLDKLKNEDPKRFKKAASMGQYHHPEGVFYGGQAPTWSHKTFLEILSQLPTTLEQVAIIDFHTGHGDYKNVEGYSLTPDSDPHSHRAKAWYQDIIPIMALPYPVTGSILGATLEHFSNIEATGIVIECGTMHLPNNTLNALRADNWLYAHGDLHSQQAKQIKKTLKEAFCPPDPDWQRTVWEQSALIMDRAIHKLREY